MANKNKQKIKKEERLSNCCGAPPTATIVDGLAVCSRCKQWADFDDLEIYRDGETN